MKVKADKQKINKTKSAKIKAKTKQKVDNDNTELGVYWSTTAGHGAGPGV